MRTDAEKSWELSQLYSSNYSSQNFCDTQTIAKLCEISVKHLDETGEDLIENLKSLGHEANVEYTRL